MEYERGFAIEVPDARDVEVYSFDVVVGEMTYSRRNFKEYSIVYGDTNDIHAGLFDGKWFVCAWGRSMGVHVLQGPFDTLDGALVGLGFEEDKAWE